MRKTESAGGVVLNSKGEVLVVSQHGDSWSLPKGHIEEGEQKIDAAIREIKEESGIGGLEYVKPLGSYQRYRIGKGGIGEDRSELKTIHMFLFRTAQHEIRPTDPGNPEARWVPKGEVEALLTSIRDKEFYRSVLGQF